MTPLLQVIILTSTLWLSFAGNNTTNINTDEHHYLDISTNIIRKHGMAEHNGTAINDSDFKAGF